MQKNRLFVFSLAVLMISAILCLTWGLTIAWPDNYHVNYGVPLVWGTHTLNTIAGPVDKWAVDLFALVIDLIFWLGLMLVVAVLALFRFKNPA